MIEKIKKYSIIIIIAILFTLISFSIVEVVFKEPDYNTFCNYNKPYMTYPVGNPAKECANITEPSNEFISDCNTQRGNIQYRYNSQNCPISFECDTCNAKYEDANKQFRFYGFIITSILGVLAIIVGLYAKSKDEVIQWIYSGFLIGGIASVFFGTMSYYNDMDRYVRPIVLIIELALIIVIALKTHKDLTTKKKK